MTDILYHGKRLSLYNLAKYVLGYSKITQKHKEVWCDPLEENLKKYNRHLYLKPRGTYKSTIYNVSLVTNLLLQDWFDNDGKFTKRVLVASATNELAQQFVGEVKQHLVDNEDLHKVFGYNPVKRDNMQEVWLQPRVVKKEPNIKAKGALSGITSEHYDIIVCDDIVSAEDRESETIREKKKRWLQDLISILEPDGLLLLIGTRWHMDDLYQGIIDINDKLSPKDQYHIEIEAVIDEKGEPLFPSIYDIEKMESLKIEKGLVEYYSQYMNNPLPSETQLFTESKLVLYNESNECLDREANYIYFDPSLGSLAKNKGDYMFVLIGARKDQKLYIRDCIATNTDTPDNVFKLIEAKMHDYSINAIGIESNGYQTLFVRRAKELGMPVIEVVNTKKKEVRIEGLEPLVSSGKILFREDWQRVYPLLIEQMVQYPVGKHDDGPDALEGLAKLVLKKRHLNSSRITEIARGGNECLNKLQFVTRRAI